MRKSIWMLGAAAWAMAASPAWAQQNTDQDGEAAQPEGATAETGAVSQTGVEAGNDEISDSGDVIVTATRRNEALSDVPIAVSAITGETLENSGVTDIRQLTQLSPSLLVSSTSSEASAGVARIRGVGTVGDNPGLESSVAVFIDGVYRSRNGVALTELGNIERVEVLRGPQGTLFGRNASAGLLSIITARPRFEFGGNASLSYGNYDFLRAEAGVTGPLMGDTIAFRIDGTYLERDGFLRDVISGRTVNNRDRYLVRGQLLFQPMENLSVRVIGDYADRNEECCGAPYLRAFDSTTTGEQPSTITPILRGLGGIIEDDTFRRRISITPGIDYAQDVEDYGGSAELVYDFGGAELTSITAYRVNDYLRGQDADFNNLDILRRLSDGGARQKFETFTQELRLQGELFEGKVDWLIGAYYADEDLTVLDNLQYGADFERYANCLLFTSLAASGLPNVVQPTPTGNCVNSAVLTGAQAQVNAAIPQLTAGLAQVQAGIAALSAIPPANRTPAQTAQLAALQTQLVTLQTQLAQARGAAPILNAVNANPARPGFGSLAAALGQPTNGLNFRGLRDRYEQNSRNFAFFTHNIFEITETVKLTLGARYTNERKTLDATFTDDNTLCTAISASPLNTFQQLPCVIPSVPGGNLSLSDRRTEDAISGTVNLSWKPDPAVLLYGSYSRGYKAGGYNLDRSGFTRSTLANGVPGAITSADLNQLEFEPENVDAYELGLKYNGQGFDLNLSLFQQKFDDFQLNTFNGVNFFVENINGCSNSLAAADRDSDPLTGACTGEVEPGVVSKGLELETFLRPSPDFNFNVGLSVIDTSYARDLVGTNGRPLSPALFQLPDRRISNSSLYTASGAATATPMIQGTDLRALFYVDARFQSAYNTGSDLDLEKRQEAVFVMNARLGIRGPEDRWAIEGFVQNLTGEDYLQVAFDAPLQGGPAAAGRGNLFSNTVRGVRSGFYPRANQLFGGFLAEPRTYGVTVRGKF